MHRGPSILTLAKLVEDQIVRALDHQIETLIITGQICSGKTAALNLFCHTQEIVPRCVFANGRTGELWKIQHGNLDQPGPKTFLNPTDPTRNFLLEQSWPFPFPALHAHGPCDILWIDEPQAYDECGQLISILTTPPRNPTRLLILTDPPPVSRHMSESRARHDPHGNHLTR